jgi:hypothetical protein
MNRGVILLLFYCKYVEHLVKRRNKQNPIFLRSHYDALDRFNIESVEKVEAHKYGKRS